MGWVPSPFATVAAWGLIATFAWAAVAKFVRATAWSDAVARFGFGGRAARAVSVAVPLAEVAIVALFVAGALSAAAALTLALVASFSAAIVRLRAAGARDKVPCGCFGGSGESDYRLLLGRNAALALLAGTVLLAPRGVSLVPPTGTQLLPTALVILAGVLLAWITAETASSLRRR